MTEKELFPPVRDLFVKRGYKVNAEVRDCDVTATKDDEFIIIELKKNLSVTTFGTRSEKAQNRCRRIYRRTQAEKIFTEKIPQHFDGDKKNLKLGLIIRFSSRQYIHLRKSYLSRPNSNRQHATIEKGVKFSQKSTAERLTQTQAV